MFTVSTSHSKGKQLVKHSFYVINILQAISTLTVKVHWALTKTPEYSANIPISLMLYISDRKCILQTEKATKNWISYETCRTYLCFDWNSNRWRCCLLFLLSLSLLLFIIYSCIIMINRKWTSTTTTRYPTTAICRKAYLTITYQWKESKVQQTGLFLWIRGFERK